ncbi:hypothetical protein EA772_21680 [Pedobacter sp. G11]|nr:hypothetical protein EA772_21680 [Pedobacter sp. G11]RYD78465.1 MAG: hypothetical protein EOP55_07095 [Sphingobacteriales bacterium]
MAFCHSVLNSIIHIMSGPKKTNDNPGSNYEEEIPKGREPEDHKTVRKPNDSTPNKPPKTENPAKQRENEEQPVDPIKKAPKE